MEFEGAAIPDLVFKFSCQSNISLVKAFKVFNQLVRSNHVFVFEMTIKAVSE